MAKKKSKFKKSYKKIKEWFVELSKSKKIVIISSIILVILLISLLLLSLGVKIRFLVSDELQINLNPLQTIINTNQSNVTFDIDVAVNKFRLCKTTCDYKIIDSYTNNIIFSDNITKNKKLNFILPKTIDKFGQQIYYFEIECNNINSLFCSTEETKRYRSSLITVNYDYDLINLDLLNNTKTLLLTKQRDILNSYNNQNSILKYINKINNTIENNVSFDTISYTEKYNILQKHYYNQEFLLTQNLLKNLIVNSFQNELFKITSNIMTYNTNIELLNFAFDNKLNEIYDYYYRTNKSKSNELNQTFIKLDVNKFEDIIDLDNLTLINENLKEINTSYYSDKQIYEQNFKLKLDNYYNLLQKIYAFDKIELMCDLAIDLNKKIENHNNNTIINTNAAIQPQIDFIKNNMFIIEINSTHLIAEDDSIPNTPGLSLSQYFNYINITNINISYCDKNTYSLFIPKLFNKINTTLSEENLIEETITELNEPYIFACIYENCSVIENKNPYPIIFLHGHSFNKADPPESSISIFYKMRKKLSDEKLIVNGGDIDYTSANNGLWSNMNLPIGISATYFYITYYDIDFFAQSIRKEEGLEIYSIRLKELIDTTLSQTNSDKVTIVAHSMGGLVARNYMNLFGENKIDKLILIATPNNGVEGRVDTLCSYFGEEKACEDMSANSFFLRKLSDYTPNIPIYNIIGQGCSNTGDGIVTKESAQLPYGEEFYVNGTCEDFLEASLHNDIVDVDKYPETYELVKQILFN